MILTLHLVSVLHILQLFLLLQNKKQPLKRLFLWNLAMRNGSMCESFKISGFSSTMIYFYIFSSFSFFGVGFYFYFFNYSIIDFFYCFDTLFLLLWVYFDRFVRWKIIWFVWLFWSYLKNYQNSWSFDYYSISFDICSRNIFLKLMFFDGS